MVQPTMSVAQYNTIQYNTIVSIFFNGHNFFKQGIYMGLISCCPSLHLNDWHVTIAEREMNGHGKGLGSDFSGCQNVSLL